MIAEPWTFGASVAGYRWAPADGARATVLLAHGFAEYAERYVARHAGLIPALVARGFAVHAFDYHGHGASPGRRGLVDVAQTVGQHRLARHALLESGAGPLLLFGHSLGGLVTAASVAMDERGVAGVVLSAPLLRVEASPLQVLAGRVLARLLPSAGVRPPLDPAGISRIDAEVDAYRQDPRGYHGPLPAIMAASAWRVAGQGWRRYRHWTAPMLLLHGTADPLTDPQASAVFVATTGAADRLFVPFEGGRHELLNDLPREEALTLILDWLTARTAPARPTARDGASL